jgi:hypothetical protein
MTTLAPPTAAEREELLRSIRAMRVELWMQMWRFPGNGEVRDLVEQADAELRRIELRAGLRKEGAS